MDTRFEQFLAAENITQAKFASTINVARASVSHILAGRNKPSYDFIKAMTVHYPNLNIEWLLFGKGKMYKDAQQAAAGVLFPETQHPSLPVRQPVPQPVQPEQPAASPVQETYPERHEPDSKPPTNALNTLDNIVQNAVTQRKVSRIIVMFDDGTYQEM